MFEFTKRLFCEHEYKYFNITKKSRPSGVHRLYHFHFVCPKCGKEITVDEYEIDNTFEYYEFEQKSNSLWEILLYTGK